MDGTAAIPREVAYAQLAHLFAEFAWRVDSGEASRAVDLFSSDVEFTVDGESFDHQGLCEQMRRREGANFETRHMVGTVRLVSATSEAISGGAIIEASRAFPPGSPKTAQSLISRWNVVIAPRDGDWRFTNVSVTRFDPISQPDAQP